MGGEEKQRGGSESRQDEEEKVEAKITVEEVESTTIVEEKKCPKWFARYVEDLHKLREELSRVKAEAELHKQTAAEQSGQNREIKRERIALYQLLERESRLRLVEATASAARVASSAAS